MADRSSGSVEVQLPIDILKPLTFPDRSIRQVGRRRIFIQTDEGDVICVDLDRADRARKIKKAVESAFKVNSDQYDLVFGGHVLEDLSEIPNDAPLLMQRGIPRTVSSPCLSPAIHLQVQAEGEKCMELVGHSASFEKISATVREAASALNEGIDPVSATGGLGGAYFFKNRQGENIAIVKPTDEEPFAPNNPNGYVGRAIGQPGMKRSVRVGEAAMREVAAYLLDHGGFSNVPHTALVKVKNSNLNVNELMGKGKNCHTPVKIASFQQFVEHDFDASECGTSGFPVKAVHRIGILDIRIFNLDRHSGNILIRKITKSEPVGWGRSSDRVEDAVELNPIDHGFSLPESLESPYLEWQHWPQASLPFMEDELEYIEQLDPFSDADLLRRELPMLREASLRVLVLSTTLLKLGAMAGLTLSDIAGMMCSEFHGMEDKASELERLCYAAKERSESQIAQSNVPHEGSLQGQLHNEYEEEIVQFELEMDRESVCELNINSVLDSIFDEDNHLSEGKEERNRLAGCNGRPMELVPLFGNMVIADSEKAIATGKSLKPRVRSPGGINFSPRSLSGSEGDRLSVSRSLSKSSLLPRFPSHGGLSVDGLRKAFPSGGGFELSEMNDMTWQLFIKCFEDVLMECLRAKKLHHKGRAILAKFGTSCKF